MRSCLRRPGWFLLAFTLLWAAPAAAQVPATGPWTLTFQSQAGDWVGQGETKTYTDLQLENIFTIGSSSNGVSGRVHDSGFTFVWDFSFSTPVGVPLTTGTYETARRNPFSSFNGLSFTGSGRGCNTVAGRFVVLEATFGSGGTVLSFAADFEQHCDNDNPALFGAIRFHSSVPIPPSFSSLYKLTMTPPVHGTVMSTGVLNCGGAGTACDETLVSPGDVTLTATPDSGYIFGGWNDDCAGGAVTRVRVNGPKVCSARFELATSPDPRTLILVSSQAGHFVGGGLSQAFSPANSGNTRISVASGSTPRSVTFNVTTLSPPHPLDNETFEDFWTFTFTAPNNGNLQPNTTYSGALGFGGTRPGLSIRGAGSCTDFGRFTVRELVFSGTTLVSAAIDAEHHCGVTGDPALVAAIRYNSTIDPVLPPVAYRLTLTAPAHGTITGTSLALNCGTTGAACDSQPGAPTSVTLAAAPDPGYVFAGWTGDCALEGSATIRINTIKTCSAAFEPLAATTPRSMMFLDWMAGSRFGGAALQEVLSSQAFGIRATPGQSGRTVEFAVDTISTSGFTSTRRFSFVAPRNQVLQTGQSFAATWSFGSTVGAGMNIDFTCSTLTGRFVVLDFALNQDGTVQRAAIDFEQHCGGADPAVFGALRFNSTADARPFGGQYPRYVIAVSTPTHGTVTASSASGSELNCGGGNSLCSSEKAAIRLVTLTATPESGFTFAGWTGACHGGATATLNVNGFRECGALFEPSNLASRTRLTLISQVGEPILQGRTEIYSGANSAWTVSWSTTSIQINVTGLVDNQEQNWFLQFRDSTGAALKPGTYSGATSSFSGTAPFMQVFGSNSCTVVGSTFTIRELEIANTTVTRLAIDFEQHCSSAGNPPLVGTIRYQSALDQGPLTLDRTSLSFSSTVMPDNTIGNTTAAQTIRLSEPPGGSIPWVVTAVSQGAWLRVTPSSGNTSATLTVSVVPGLAGLGAHTGTITVTAGGVALPPVTVTWTLLGLQTDPPFGLFESPAAFTQNVSGAVPLTGWALDDVEVTRVQIWRQPHPSDPPAAIQQGIGGDPNPKVFIGDATMIDGARPDVEAVYFATPNRSRAGWGYMMLTRGLVWDGGGFFTLYAVAIDREGHSRTIGSTAISVNNALSVKPFGTIDTPGQGATASGLYPNTGWVMTPMSGTTIPAGNVRLMIDGTLLPGVFSTAPRADISATFPGMDTSQAGRGLFVDTTAFADGMHTIAWIVTDSAGRAEGIGSRFFRVANGGPSSLRAAERAAARPVSNVASQDVDAAPLAMSAVRVRQGFDAGTPFETLQASSDGFAVETEELERVEMKLALSRGTAYSGYLRALGELRPLPAGTALDASTGTFTWQPPAGFLGDYDFVFVATGKGGIVSRQELRVTIRPRTK